MSKDKGKKANAKPKAIEDILWDAANKLRGSVEPADYKHIILGLVFLKYAGDRFEKRRAAIIAAGHQKFADTPSFYAAENDFYLKPEARWSELVKKSKSNELPLFLDSAFKSIEATNESLRGALPSNYYAARYNAENVTRLSSLLDVINRIDTTAEHDLMGRIYENLLMRFSILEANVKGEFYTPKAIVNLIAELIEPFDGTVYDPCCGSGGMFVQSARFIENHGGNRNTPTIVGQEYTPTTYKLARMNLAVRGLSADLGDRAADTFFNDLHKDMRADYIMANPPFNQKDWRKENELVDDARWAGYKTPPASNANYAWILHIASKLKPDGVAGFLLANGALGGDDETEHAIRRQLLINDLVEAIIVLPRELFYSTDISVTLWILNRNKKARSFVRNGENVKWRDRTREVLFIDLRTKSVPFEKSFATLPDEAVKEAVDLYHAWQTKGVKAIPEYCFPAKLADIEKRDYSLIPSKYIEFVDRDSGIDYPKEMKKLQKEFAGILVDETAAAKELRVAFEGLGYGL